MAPISCSQMFVLLSIVMVSPDAAKLTAQLKQYGFMPLTLVGVRWHCERTPNLECLAVDVNVS